VKKVLEQQHREKSLIAKLSITRQTLRRWIKDGKFPKGTLIGDRTRVWSESELKKWLESKKEEA